MIEDAKIVARLTHLKAEVDHLLGDVIERLGPAGRARSVGACGAIGLHRLERIAHVLETSVAALSADGSAQPDGATFRDAQAEELLETFRAVGNVEKQRLILDLARVLAQRSDDATRSPT